MNDIEILENYLKYIKQFDNNSDFIPALENLIQRNKDLEEIEKEHKEENGRLREELENIEYIKRNFDYCLEQKIKEGIKLKLKEIVDECIPKKENIITKELEYTPNTNGNSYLTQRILELLEESEE